MSEDNLRKQGQKYLSDNTQWNYRYISKHSVKLVLWWEKLAHEKLYKYTNSYILASWGLQGTVMNTLIIC